MGLVSSRLNLDGLRPGRRRRRRRSQQEETLYSYSLNKNYFSNYFLMGGERFEVTDPDYLFGDNCDLNFLTCTKPYALPYKRAQASLMAHLNTKQNKAMNKVSSRVGNSLSSPLNILTGRNRQVSQSRKQDAQTQTLNKGLAAGAGGAAQGPNGPEPSQPLVMLINIRKETLRLVRSANVHNLDSDQNSLMTNAGASAVDVSGATGPVGSPHKNGAAAASSSSPRRSNANRHSMVSGRGHGASSSATNCDDQLDHAGGGAYYSRGKYHSDDASSIASHTLSSSAQSTTTSKSGGYTSVKDVPHSPPPSSSSSSSSTVDDDEDDECYQDALNEPSTVSLRGDHDNGQCRNITSSSSNTTKDETNHHSADHQTITITINQNNHHQTSEPPGGRPLCDMTTTSRREQGDARQNDTSSTNYFDQGTSSRMSSTHTVVAAGQKKLQQGPATTTTTTISNRVYNIEFAFDAEVDCSIRIFYFCTREVTSSTVSYKPQHATYKSKTYIYKRGLNQRFEQQEHTFQPYLFDEDLLIYKPLDLDGNYNSGAVFPIVIHLSALEGPAPRQSQSLVATVEKSQLDESYSIKALKQLIFVDGVQYILQDIYGIENRPLAAAAASPRVAVAAARSSASSATRTPRLSRNNTSANFRSSCASLYSSGSNLGSNLNLSDTASIASVLLEGTGTAHGDTQDGDPSSLAGGQNFKSLGSENTFECVICMSDERDTMLLPCRHLCLCSSCAQSLRYQASSCPICRCPFKAALNLRVIQRRHHQVRDKHHHRTAWSANASNEALATSTTTTSHTSAASADTSVKRQQQQQHQQQQQSTAKPPLDKSEQYQASTTTMIRRESITSPATPLLAQSGGSSGVNKHSLAASAVSTAAAAADVDHQSGARAAKSERTKSASARSLHHSPASSSARDTASSSSRASLTAAAAPVDGTSGAHAAVPAPQPPPPTHPRIKRNATAAAAARVAPRVHRGTSHDDESQPSSGRVNVTLEMQTMGGEQ